MELETLTEDPHVARRAFLEYREAVRGPAKQDLTLAARQLREIDEEMMRAYRELAKGVTLLRLSETILAGGMEGRENGRGFTTCLPRLAVARATARRVWCEGVDQDGDVGFSWALTAVRNLSWSRMNSLHLERLFEREDDWKDRNRGRYAATVPTVPPRFRPPLGLGGYHVLFEAEWSAPPAPADPALLKHLGGDLWAVLATWDLTPLEAAVLGQRS